MADALSEPHVFCKDEKHVVDQSICHACKDLRYLEDETTRLDQLVIIASDYKHRLNTLRTNYNAVHSPIIRILPTEVLSSIFELYLPDRYDRKTGRSFRFPDHHKVILKIGAICRRWREVAWATPMLWATLTLSLEAKCLTTTLHELAEQWLARSGNLPLSIWISGSSHSGTESDADRRACVAIMDLINTYSYRWSLFETWCEPHLLSRVRCPQALRPDSIAPILESLHLRSSIFDKSDAFFDFGCGLPYLTHVDIARLNLRNIHLDWSNVTHIEGQLFFADECLEVLRQTPRVTLCEFRICSGDSGAFSMPTSVVRMPHLKCLKMSIDDDVDDSVRFALFEKIEAPSLAVLELGFGLELLPVGTVVSFLQRSSCAISKLYIKRGWVETEDLVTLLRSTPSLQHLDFNCGEEEDLEYITDEFIHSLAESSTVPEDSISDALLPHLRVLHQEGSVSFSWPTLIDLFDSPPHPNHTMNPSSPYSGANTPPRRMHRRPLERLIITLNDVRVTEYDYPNSDTIRRFKEASEEFNCNICIFDFRNQIDIYLSHPDVVFPSEYPFKRFLY